MGSVCRHGCPIKPTFADAWLCSTPIPTLRLGNSLPLDSGDSALIGSSSSSVPGLSLNPEESLGFSAFPQSNC